MRQNRWTAWLMALGVWASIGFSPPPRSTVDIVAGTIERGGRPAAGAVVYLLRQPAAARDAVEANADTAVLDQRSLSFVPGVLAVKPGTTVEFLNSDGVLHNVFSPGRVVGVGEPFDLGTYSRGEMRRRTFTELGAHTILCNVHPEMVAYIVSVPAEHRAVTDSDGRFTMGDVPSGSYRLQVWYPQSPEFAMDVRVSPDLKPLAISLEPAAE